MRRTQSISNYVKEYNESEKSFLTSDQRSSGLRGKGKSRWQWNKGELALWVTEEGTDLAPVGRSEMIETPGKFVGTKRRGNLDVFLERGPRKPKISETEGLCGGYESETAYRVPCVTV